MLKSKAKMIAMTLIILGCSIFIMNQNLANQNNSKEIQDWKVKMTSDTKELKDTREIGFKVEDNANVVNGKIAPGIKAIATIEIDLIGTKVPVDISCNINDMNVLNFFKLTTKLDGEIYNSKTIKTIKLPRNSEFTEENGKRVLTLELEWQNYEMNSEVDTEIGKIGGTIKIPVTINVRQHI